MVHYNFNLDFCHQRVLKHPVDYINDRLCDIRNTQVRRKINVEINASLGELLDTPPCPEVEKKHYFE